MDITIYPKKLSGIVQAIPSKSQAHRLLICAAFADRATTLLCRETNQDVEATVGCLRTLGATIIRTVEGYDISPVASVPQKAWLNCHESGSTLRFMLPIVGALGVDAVFKLEGRLPQRPLTPLWEEMERMGCSLSRPTYDTIRCTGQLKCGQYRIAGNISSQFISGLLFAMVLIPGHSSLEITGTIESKPYIDMTYDALSRFGVNNNDFTQPLCSPGTVAVEGDWSNAAFFLTAAFLGNNVKVEGLALNSKQGDRVCSELLTKLESNITVCAADIPDLVPILAIAAGASKGAIFLNIQRLRLKESDRVATVASMLEGLGAKVDIDRDRLTISPTRYHSCTIDSAGDHRIAMSAAIAATVSDGPITILDAQCVNKSYPAFWQIYRELGGHYEQHIR